MIAALTIILGRVVSLAAANGLADHPIAARSVTYLNQGWEAHTTVPGPNKGHKKRITVPATVPGDLITDLQRFESGAPEVAVGDPLYELNWLEQSKIWDGHTWTYSTNFTVPSGGTSMLVFDGVKMGARVLVDGKPLINITDQFLRYSGIVPAGRHQLSLVFDPSIDCAGRWMSCTGGWDWAPYTNTFQDGIPTFSKGIWKSVYVAQVASGGAAIMHVVPQIKYAGEYPVEPLTDESHGGFEVTVKVHMWAESAVQGMLTVRGNWEGGTATQRVSVSKGDSALTLEMPTRAKAVKLWWPVGHGAQPLYNLSVIFTPSGVDAAQVTTNRRIGFRFFALVTGNDTDPNYVAASKGKDGTASLGMLWRINGAAIFSKGANMIPMEELEGRMSAAAHRRLVQSAVDGGMNTLRVWGGGMFLPREWYEACDELGILVFHDMQYAQNGHSPKNEPIQEAELRHQIRRLSNHPSIVMWDGCNECQVVMGTDTGIYATFVMTVVAEEDASRVVWPSCPALGWTGGVHRLTSIPNGLPLTTPSSGLLIELHGPYQHGAGFPTVNNGGSYAPVSPSMHGAMPIEIPRKHGTTIGLGQANIFGSEFGAAVFSSFESMAPTLAKEHWGIHGGAPPDTCRGPGSSAGGLCTGNNTMAQRNYACDNIIVEYFGWSDFEMVGEAAFKQQLWQCMVGQALLIKSNIETRRSTNQFGIIVWQYNEIWPTGGWGSIEYGTVGFTSGQVLGGRWKPLHYWYKKSLFADVMATCGKSSSGTSVACYIKNDLPRVFTGEVDVSSVAFKTGEMKSFKVMQVSMPAGAGTIQWFEVEGIELGSLGKEAMLIVTVTESGGKVVCDNAVGFTAPKNMNLPQAHVSARVADKQNEDGTIDIDVVADAFALYVTLTTLAQGRFEDNAFVMLPGVRTMKFLPFAGFDAAELRRSLRVEHVATYAASDGLHRTEFI